ncbi:MAG: response regulator [Bdellovibrionota bacterium]|nr:response regulator [Bdellovibrionota bacterium]
MAAPTINSEEIQARGPLQILIVEDTQDAQTLIKMFLRKTPFKLTFADNGEIAIGTFKDKPFHLVLMDVTMPVMDGITALREIRKWENEMKRPLTPIIALTAKSLPEEIDELMKEGFTSFFAKPYEKGRLIEVILKYSLPFKK